MGGGADFLRTFEAIPTQPDDMDFHALMCVKRFLG